MIICVYEKTTKMILLQMFSYDLVRGSPATLLQRFSYPLPQVSNDKLQKVSFIECSPYVQKVSLNVHLVYTKSQCSLCVQNVSMFTLCTKGLI